MTDITRSYLQHVQAILARVAADPALARAADAVAAALSADRLVHVTGSGHSHLIAEEVFYRAGGIAAAQAVLDERLMLHRGAVASTAAERQEGLAAEVLAHYAIAPGDVVVVVSNSGRNAYPVEAALEAAARGATVVAVTSLAMAAAVPSRHSSGRLLKDVAAIVIDNGVPPGDAVVEIPGLADRMGPVSTIAGAFVLNAVLAEAVGRLAARGIPVDVYRSANAAGGATSDDIAARWRPRIAGL